MFQTKTLKKEETEADQGKKLREKRREKGIKGGFFI